MKKIGLVLALAVMSVHGASYAAKADNKSGAAINESSPDTQKVGYSFGYIIGKSNSDALKNLDLDSFVKGFKDGYSGNAGALTDDQIKATLLKYKQAQDAQEMQTFKTEADKNAKAGAAFLAENGKKAGVVTTNSGLQYLVIKQGTGKQPASDSRVKVHYEGRLIDGTVFDSSIDRGEPLTFPLNQVIAGWTEGVQLMKEGAKYRLFIPSTLAYGETGANTIPPSSTLIFDVELLEVLPAQVNDKADDKADSQKK